MLRGAHRPLGVVLLRHRMAEQRHQSVAELLGDNLGLEVPLSLRFRKSKISVIAEAGLAGLDERPTG